MRKVLSLVLAKHIGETMTPELAIAMAKELLGVVENPIDVTQFEPMLHGKYRVACERLEEIMPELQALQNRHYDETEREKEGHDFAANYERLVDMERAGQLMQFTARVTETGELIGSMMVYLIVSISNGSTYSQEGEFYIAPEHRGGMLAVRLWQFAERAVHTAGAVESVCESRLENGADRMARFMGYEPQAIKFSKRLHQKEIA